MLTLPHFTDGDTEAQRSLGARAGAVQQEHVAARNSTQGRLGPEPLC